jgi:putative nucleotidyltransferase with HDIG domain
MRRWGEIKDPVHGYISVSEAERSVLDTPQMQRLRRIRQLSAAYQAYPGAEHTRFHHSLGVMHVAGGIAARLGDVGLLEEAEAEKLRLAALLHDIGHGPFSHSFEEVLERRQLTHEDMGARIVRETEVADVLKEHGFDPKEMSQLAVGLLDNGKQFMNQVIAGQFSADVMDYLVRDSYFTGVEYGRIDIDRLVQSMDILDGGLAMSDTALYVLEAFVIARYEMFKAVYFHRTVRAGEVMLVRAMMLADEKLGFTSFKTPEEYHRLDDAYVLAQLSSLKGSRDRASRTAYDLGRRFVDRRLIKCAYERLMHSKDRLSIMTPGVRESLEEEIAAETGVDKEYIFIDVSSASSVPYYSRQNKPQDIPLFHRNIDGSKSPRSLSELSPLGGALIGYLDIMRVYARQTDLEAVMKASEEKFGKETAATKVSY